MFETHGNTPSNRYRDLVDLALLVTIEGIDAGLLRQALDSRARNARNPVTMPTVMLSPGNGWVAGYRAEVRRSTLPTQLHDLDDSLAWVGACVNPILDGTVSAGRWNPQTRTWEQS
jgi:hypothetical protein